MGVKNRFLEIRLKMGYKFQKDFAEFLELDPSHYNRYEKNKIQPRLEQIYIILKKLNMGFFDLFYLEE
ncbi:helix-turn-helix transcriptional regulator [Tissierella praeacuta]|uniref:helix-turn-helix transcriptional regulator n=1 Tax=Tissierella praeacuta TaxID=43131 RepID=UPI0028B19DEE|nr:helix-turn-helix transcriptional regulator [Tissierella praeacuta]